MRILIVGDVSGTFSLNFVKHLKAIDQAIEIDALNINESLDAAQIAKKSGHFRNVYSHFRSYGVLSRIPKIRGIFRETFQLGVERKIFAKHDYDVICLFGMWPLSCRLINRMKHKSSFWIGVIMGSDYLQMNNRRDKVPFIKAIQSCQRLIVANPVLFTRISAENIINNDALRSVYFGLEPLELLDSMKHIDAAESKKHFGISPDTLVITCGYNASPNQQHIEIINALTNARSIPERHLVVVPLTYGGNTGYKQEVREILSKSGLNYRTIDTFLPDRDIAMWRKASDIFIQVQKTDALSGSMQESLFCGNIVITGAWLPYDVLKEKGIAFFEVSNVKEITTKLDFIISNYPQIREEIRSTNTPEKFTHAFWKNCITGWHDVLMEYRQSKDSINAN